MTNFRKIALGASVAALALGGFAATSASASTGKTFIFGAVTGYDPITGDPLTDPAISEDNAYGSYGILATANNTYDFTFTLAAPLKGDTSIQFQGETVRGAAEAVSFKLYEGVPTLGSPEAGTLLGSSGAKALSPTLTLDLAPGSYYVNVVYNRDLTGSKESISGNITTLSVPEPASWALMLIGVGAVGAGLRRRASKVAAAV
jgi:hypothetical protein